MNLLEEDKAYIFDIDDTLVTTQAKIQIYDVATGETKEITPSEWNSYRTQMKSTEVPDFSQFESDEIFHTTAKPTVYFQVMKNISDAVKRNASSSKIYILTARNDKIVPIITKYLDQYGIKPDGIYTVGDRKDKDIAELKKEVIQQIRNRHSGEVTFFDDDAKNIKLASEIAGVRTRHVNPQAVHEFLQPVVTRFKTYIAEETVEEAKFWPSVASAVVGANMMFNSPMEAEAGQKQKRQPLPQTPKPVVQPANNAWLDQVTSEIKDWEYPVYLQKNHMKNGKHMPYLDPNKKDWIIGYGHKLTPVEKIKYRNGATRAQIEALLNSDMKKMIANARALLPNFDRLTPERKKAFINAVYRGEIKAGHRTLALLRQGKFAEAAIEYLDREDFKLAKEKGINKGIISRMEKNANRFARG